MTSNSRLGTMVVVVSVLFMMRAGQAGGAQDPVELAFVSAIRYVEAMYGLQQGLGYVHVDELAVRDHEGRRITLVRAQQDAVARAVGLQTRSVTSVCEIEGDGVLYSAVLQKTSGDDYIVSITYSQRTGTGWGAATHVLRLPTSSSSSEVEVQTPFKAHGPCSQLQ
jgi:hypothetical protein